MTQKTEPPAISVVIPAFNAAWCVHKAIDSVLAQEFRDFELLVIDDGSTDNTDAVLARYGDAIQVVRQPGQACTTARVDTDGGIGHARQTQIFDRFGQ
jgi:glycosyltransferase involved in cell wall biosynthesis